MKRWSGYSVIRGTPHSHLEVSLSDILIWTRYECKKTLAHRALNVLGKKPALFFSKKEIRGINDPDFEWHQVALDQSDQREAAGDM